MEIKINKEAPEIAYQKLQVQCAKLIAENEELKKQLKTAYIKGMRHMAKALKDYDRTDGAWTDYFEHTVDKVLQKELAASEVKK